MRPPLCPAAPTGPDLRRATGPCPAPRSPGFRALALLSSIALLGLLAWSPEVLAAPEVRLSLLATLTVCWCCWRCRGASTSTSGAVSPESGRDGASAPSDADEAAPPWRRADWLAAALLLVLSALVHLPGLDRWPVEVGWDEGVDDRVWRQQLDGKPFRPLLFYDEELMETASYWLQGTLLDRCGLGLAGFRLVNALWATPAPPLLYGLLRTAIAPGPAFAGAACFAVSGAAARLTRDGCPTGLTITFTLLAALLLAAGIRHRSVPLHAASGLAIGAGCWFYLSCRLGAAGLLLASVAGWRRTGVRAPAAFAFAALLATAPLLVFEAAHFARAGAHVREVSIFNGEVRAPLEELAANVLRTLRNLAGAERGGWLGRPLLEDGISALLFLGLAELWMRRRGSGWVLAALLPAVLAVGQLSSLIVASSFDSGEPRRFIVGLPFYFALAALALDALERAVRDTVGSRGGIAVRLGFVALVAAQAAEGFPVWMERFQEDWRWKVTYAYRAAAGLAPGASPAAPAALGWEPAHPVGGLSPAIPLLARALGVTPVHGGNLFAVPPGPAEVACVLGGGRGDVLLRSWFPEALTAQAGFRGGRGDLALPVLRIPRSSLERYRGVAALSGDGHAPRPVARPYDGGAAVAWEGWLHAPAAGRYRFATRLGSAFRLTLHGLELGRESAREALLLQEGYHRFRLEPVGPPPAGETLLWSSPGTANLVPPGPESFLREIPSGGEALLAAEAAQGRQLRLVAVSGDPRWECKGGGSPWGILKGQGRVLIGSSGSPHLREFELGGSRSRVLERARPEEFPPVRYDQYQPVRLAAGPAGSTYVAACESGLVTRRGRDGEVLRDFGGLRLGSLLDVESEPSTGGFVASVAPYRPAALGLSGEPSLLVRVRPDGRVAERVPLEVPGSLAVTPSGTLFVVEILPECVTRLAPGGRVELRWRLSGASAATRLAVDPAGRLWVLDGAAGDLQVFEADGRLLAPPVDLAALFGAGPADSYKFVDLTFAAGGDLLILYKNFEAGFRRLRVEWLGAD